jgi:hypothetical protein
MVITMLPLSTVAEERSAAQIKSATYINEGDEPTLQVEYDDADGNTWIELYLIGSEVKEGDPKGALGTVEVDGKTYHLIGIQTIDSSNAEKYYKNPAGRWVIKDTLYLAGETKPAAGTKVAVVIETGDSDKTLKMSDKLEITVPENGKSVTVSAACAHEKTDGGKITKPATCTTAGTRVYTCELCKATVKTETIKALGHNYSAKVVAPTCTERGYTHHQCTRCAANYKDTYKDALGHKWNNGVVTKTPTYTKEGVKTFTCSKCKATKTETLPVKEKKENTMTVKVKKEKLTVKYTFLKKKSKTIKIDKALAISKAKGDVTYKKESGNSKIKVDKKTGAITVKKRLKKGTYKIKVKITAAGTSSYSRGFKTVTLKIKVK